ncbi:MAG: DUF3786 domain-containing protein [Desulfobacterales bacterium]
MTIRPSPPRPAAVFQETYRNYLSQVQGLELASRALRLGAREISQGLEIPFLGEPYQVSRESISMPSGDSPDFSVRLILLKYILLCPPEVPPAGEWTPYHGFKDSGPLTVYFPNTVEQPLADHFSGRASHFENASLSLGGRTPSSPLPYDRCYQFRALPRIPLLAAFNEQDDEFPAQCRIFFKASADQFLDCECLAILGGILSKRLIAAAGLRQHMF